MFQIDFFLDNFINYDKDNIYEVCLKVIQLYLDDLEFDSEFIRSKLLVVVGFCSWCINIVGYYRVYCIVEFKRIVLVQVNVELVVVQEKFCVIINKI